MRFGYSKRMGNEPGHPREHSLYWIHCKHTHDPRMEMRVSVENRWLSNAVPAHKYQIAKSAPKIRLEIPRSL